MLTDDEVWLRGYLSKEDRGKDRVNTGDDTLRDFRARFPKEQVINAAAGGGIGKASVAAIVELLRARNRQDAASVVEAIFKHIDETGGLSPEWTPPGRGG